MSTFQLIKSTSKEGAITFYVRRNDDLVLTTLTYAGCDLSDHNRIDNSYYDALGKLRDLILDTITKGDNGTKIEIIKHIEI
jgi:hypothetical protein